MPTPSTSACLCWTRLGQLILPVTLGLVLSAGCGSGSETEPPVSPPQEPAPSVNVPEETASPAAAEAETNPVAPSAEANSEEVSQRLLEHLEAYDSADRAKTNPLSGKTDAIKKGKEEYMSVCMPCHGESGKGDGPAAAVMGIVPADLTSPLRAKVISAGDRYLIMKNGIPGTTMQAFGAALSDNQIWTLLAYAETLVVDSSAADEGTPPPQ